MDNNSNNLPILDLNTFNEMKAIIGNSFVEMLSMYSSESEEYIKLIEQGVARNKIEDIVRPAHTLKSSSRQIGALRLGGIAAEIEQLSRDQKIEPIKALATQLREVFTATNNLINTK